MKKAIQIETTFNGHLFKVQVLRWSDEQGRKIEREVVRHPGAVVIVPVLDAKSVIMIRNYRVAVDEVLWEFPAGKLEPGEQAEQAAGRELEEETGYRAGQIRKIGEFYTSPGFADELMRVFVAEELTLVRQKLEPGEEIEVRVVSIDEAMAKVLDGRIRDAKTIAGLLMWQSLRCGAASQSLASAVDKPQECQA